MAALAPEEILARELFIGGANRRFGDVALEHVRERADELRAAVGWGPTVRVAPVARAWRELAMAMESAAVERVEQLDRAAIEELAPKLWVVLPGR